MKIYLVGGAVRDKLLGLPVKERDWVVVGGTVNDMIKLGYRQVGKEFPVFLHPDTNEEYALARRERKTHAGYKGFVFDTSTEVTLEADLERRDLTINAMAETETGLLIDPFHGQKDLDNKILKHVSLAFTEDPVRILRVGRFLARYSYLGFNLAQETLDLMVEMVKKGEVNALVAERVWKELERALSEKNPEQFFTVLNDCHALSILFPQLTLDGAGINALKAAVHLTEDTAVRFASLLHAVPEKKSLSSLCHRYRVPNDYQQLAILAALHHENALIAKQLSPEALLNLLTAVDIFRRKHRFQQFLIVCQAIAFSRHLLFDAIFLLSAANLVQAVDVKTLINQGFTNQALAERLKNERLKLLSQQQKR
jgi:tRNA nucleotidyltransferase (CCA-adding enzyme)